ncbi:MAG: aminotransferase class III-fold pyridoxal phosphate-dependent enzyme, partial [Bacteroidales bacterium]
MDHIIWNIGQDLTLAGMIRADNCHLYDAAGNKFIDLESGVWCTSVGHCHPRVQKRLAEQAAQIAHTGYCYAHPVIDETAAKILQLTRLDGGKCVFLCSGSEAIEFGIRAIRSIDHRPLMLTFSDSYCGAYGSASAKRADEWHLFNWHDCNCAGEMNCEDCPLFKKIPFYKISTFLFEPGSSSGLVKFPPAKLISAICSAIRSHGGFVLANEVTTGIGRTGRWFGFEHYDIHPDIVAIGKGVGNGYPVSITAMSSAVMKQLEKKPFIYSQSHQNDPLGAAVALEVIRVIEDEKLIERCRSLGTFLQGELESIRQRSGHILEIRSRGLMLAIELNGNASHVQKELLTRGFILVKRPGHEVLR